MVTKPKPEHAPEARPEAEEAKIDSQPALWTRRHLLDVDDLTRDELTLLLETATGMEEV